MQKRLHLTLLIFFLALLPLAGQQFTAKRITLQNSKLDNLYQIDEGVYRSEQPSADDFKALEQYGIEEVLNLRRLHSDNKKAQGTSLKLHRLKTNAHSISIEELTEALKIIHRRKGPILIHCRHGSDRTGAVIAMYRIVFQGVSKEEAIEEMKNGGFGFHRIYTNIVRTIRKADVAQIKQKIKEAEGE